MPKTPSDATIPEPVTSASEYLAKLRRQAALLKTGALQDAILNSANFSSIATDEKGVIQIFNVGAERMLGYMAADVLNRITPADISDPLEVVARAETLSLELATTIRPGFEALVFKASRGIEDIYELTYIRKDGSRFPAVVSVTALRDAQDAIIGYLLIGTDNTARKQAEQKVVELNRDFVSFLENTSDFIYFKDSNSRFRFCSQAMANITGHASWRDMVGKNDEEVFPKDMAQIYYEEELPIFREGKTLLNKLDPYYDASGNTRWVSTNKWPLLDHEGKVAGLFGISHDITERKLLEEQVHQMAFHDTLTKLPNRNLLNDRLSQAMSANKRSGCFGALMFLDLDNFKSLNDAHGHEVGDLLLIEAAVRLKSCVREIDTVSRFGGDEFIVLIGELSADKSESGTQAGIIAEKVRAALARPYVLQTRHKGTAPASVEHCCTASIGVALFGKQDASRDDILKWADTAMYQAKEAGCNLIRFYDSKT
jgi:diguanylate cyclase (GGDEF)-like protein/PAS domain S-box-containing protein